MSATAQRRLGAAVRRRRLELGLTQQELGLAAGTDGAAISKLESGLRSPRLDAMAAIAAPLRIPLAQLFEDVEA